MITKIICGYFVYMLPIRRFSGQSKIVRGEARRAMLLSAALGACRPLSALPHRCRKPPSLRDNEGRKSLAVSVGSVRESISPEMAHQLRSRSGPRALTGNPTGLRPLVTLRGERFDEVRKLEARGAGQGLLRHRHPSPPVGAGRHRDRRAIPVGLARGPIVGVIRRQDSGGDSGSARVSRIAEPMRRDAVSDDIGGGAFPFGLGEDGHKDVVNAFDPFQHE